MGWIYAFRDARYDHGIKIGWDGDKRCKSRINKAQSYSPVKIICEAVWQIPDELKTRLGSARKVEGLACKGLLPLSYQNNGREWFDVDITSALERVSANLNLQPQKIEFASTVNWDDFRSPRDIEKAQFSIFKQVLWVYEENLTGRIKVQRIDEWKTPREGVKTYSRNGFKPMRAFTYTGRTCKTKNLGIVDLWKETMKTFHAPVDNSSYGWLPDNVGLGDVYSFLSGSGYNNLDPPFVSMPEGVKQSYN